jgi:hypothetical protein
MTDKIKLYQYDYAAYFTGNIMEIEAHEGYNPRYFTKVPVPEIPAGHNAKFEKTTQQWIITDKPAPEYIDVSSAIESVVLDNPEFQTEPKVI